MHDLLAVLVEIDRCVKRAPYPEDEAPRDADARAR